ATCGCERGKYPHPLPLVPHDMLAWRRVAISPGEHFRDRLDAVGHLAVTLAKTERLHRPKLRHLALLVQRHRNGAEPAEHALLAEPPVEHVEMRHAVEQRDDRGVRPDR